MNNVNSNHAVIQIKLPEPKRTQLIVNGCKVTLNFPVTPDGMAVGDIKQMMLTNAVKV